MEVIDGQMVLIFSNRQRIGSKLQLEPLKHNKNIVEIVLIYQGLLFLLLRRCQILYTREKLAFEPLYLRQYPLLKIIIAMVQSRLKQIIRFKEILQMEKFIRSKLSQKLKSYIEFESTSLQELSLNNVSIKPMLLQQLSQVLSIPMTLVTGTITSVRINKAWDKLFNRDEPLVIQIIGMNIKAQLSSQFQPSYVHLKRKNIIKKFTRKINKNQKNDITFLNKLKGYFFGSFVISFKKITLQIQLPLKHQIIVTLGFEQFKLHLQKENKLDKTSFTISQLFLSYRMKNDSKQEYFINDAHIDFLDQKHKKQSTKKLYIKKSVISLSNQNFNDVRRVIELIKWHNSFVLLPQSLWIEKPTILGNVPPKKKLKYICELMLFKIKQKKNFAKILLQRKNYLNLYRQACRQMSNLKIAFQLQQIEQKMEIWKIKAYRQFAHRLQSQKNKINKTQSNLATSEQQKIVVNDSKWFRSWFRTKQQKKMLNQLQKKLQDIDVQLINQSFITHIQEITIKLKIRSHCDEPFLNVYSLNNKFQIRKNQKKHSAENDKIEYDKTKIASIQRFMISFDKYNGHCEECTYFIHEDSMKKMSSQDQFQDIQNFMELYIQKQQTKIVIQPLSLTFNEQIKQKLSIFKLQRIHNNFQSTENLIMNPNPIQYDNIQSDDKLQLQCSIQLMIPQSMYQSQAEFLSVYLTDIIYKKSLKKQELSIRNIDISGLLYVEKNIEYSISQSIVAEKQYQYQMITLLTTKLICQIQIHESFDDIIVKVSPIQLKFSKVNYLCKLIKFLSRFKPKEKAQRHLFKLKNIRRKQSIGEQYIDACENLNEHIVKSVISSEITKRQKYVIKQKKDIKLLAQLPSIKFILQTEEVELINFTVKVYLFSELKSINLEDDKNIIMKINKINSFIKNLKQVQEQMGKIFKNTSSIQQKNAETKTSNVEFHICNLELNILIFDQNIKKIALNFPNIQFEKKKNSNIFASIIVNLIYYPFFEPQIKKINNTEQTLLENMKIFYHGEKGYNKDQKIIKINQLRINIKPIFIKELLLLIERIRMPDQKIYWVVNDMVTPVDIFTNGNYTQLKYSSEAAGLSSSCDIIYFGKKGTLNLKQNSSSQIYSVTKNLNILKTIHQQFHFHLRSNLRIINQHDRLLSMRIVELTELKSPKKAFSKDFTMLSSARVNTLEENDVINIFRSDSLKNYDDSQDSENCIGKSNKKRRNTLKYQKNASQQGKQLFRVMLQPKKQIDFIIDTQEAYIQFSDVNYSGISYEIFQMVKIEDILGSNIEKNLNSTWSSEQIQHTLVIHGSQSIDEDTSSKIFEIKIMSPVVIINYLPWVLKYRYSKQQIDVMQTIKTAGKQIRKRSFQVIPMQKVSPFTSSQNRNIRYQQITEIELSVKDYNKKFRLDHIVSDLFEKDKQDKVNQEDLSFQDTKQYKNILCLNNGMQQMQIILDIKIKKSILEISVYPQYVFINMTSLQLNLNIQQSNYTYPSLKFNPLTENTYYKDYLKMNEEKLSSEPIIKQLFSEYSQNICIFTGDLDPTVQQFSRFGQESPKQEQKIFTKSSNFSLGKKKQKIIEYGAESLKVIVRKIFLPSFPSINLMIFMPSLLIINKSDWNFFVKGEGQKLKKLPKHEIELVIISSKVAIQACQQQEEISYGEWLKITLNTLGTIYYAKQMTSSNGYESREYELRKKRLKKAPKIFYRIVMTKYQYGYQMLIEQSQYPPVTFINRCKSRIRISESKQQSIQEMQYNQMAQYAPKIPYYSPVFSLSMVENYQFLFLGQFHLNQAQKRFGEKIKISIQDYKDKKIVMIQQSSEKYLSEIRNELLLEKIQKIQIIIEDLTVSILNPRNRQLSCTILKEIDFLYQTKNSKRYIRFRINDINAYSYHTLQPCYLFHCSSEKQIFKIFKKKLGQRQQIINLQLVIDYHKHATILQKCLIRMLPITIIVEANTIIDFIKYFHEVFEPIQLIIRNLGRCRRNKNKQKENMSSWVNENFIIESFSWNGIKITLSSHNLNNFCLFIDQKSIKYLLKWIEWMGELKPITFKEIIIEYEQYTVSKMINLIHVKSLISKITQILLHYPLQEVYNVFSLLATLMGLNQSGDKNTDHFNTLKKIVLSTFKLLRLAISSGDSQSFAIQEYRRKFVEHQKNQHSGFIEKIMNFKYAEWKNNEEVNPRKLTLTVQRLERYSHPTVIQPYDQIKSRIKLALDSHCRNKIYRQITFAEIINKDTIIGVTEELVVFYFISKDEWIVMKPQCILSMEIRQSKKRHQGKRLLQLSTWIINDQQSLELSHINEIIFSEIIIDKQVLTKIWKYICELKLLSYF